MSYGVPVQPDTKPVWLYLRLSKYHKDGADAIERQRIDLQRKLAREGGWTIMGEYVDNDSASVSAARVRRGWTRLNEAIDAGEVTALAFWKLDRTNRIAYQILEWLGHCRTLGVRLVSHEDSADELNSASANGKIVSGIKALFAEIETDTMSIRQLDSKKHLAEAGFIHGGTVPFGWAPGEHVTDEQGRTGRRLVPHPIEYPALQSAVDMVLSGHSLTEVGQEWVDRFGIVTAADRPIQAGNIRRMLVSPRMIGYRMRQVPEHQRGVRIDLMKYVARDVSGEPVIGQEPVCDLVTWRRMLKALESRRTQQGHAPWGSSGFEWILTGLLRCPGCGRGLFGCSKAWTTASGERRRAGRYSCRANARFGKGSCPGGRSVQSGGADAYVLGWLTGYVTPERLEAARARAVCAQESAAVSRGSEELEAARAERDELLRKQGSGQYRGQMVSLMVQMLRDVTDRIEMFERQLARSAPPETLSPTGNELMQLWPDVTVSQKRSALALVIDRVDVAPGTGSAAERLTVVPKAGLLLPGE
ncbi:recombinase family protein [Leekyejoonella antrihumi]|uniref:recombinase family protein n=1 Tax=Leekyejoonella antrihumi TaxID=1660198 RepID=UPI001FE3E25D|nr:recombinase family protein [Leekyejoonella antrihumi]